MRPNRKFIKNYMAKPFGMVLVKDTDVNARRGFWSDCIREKKWKILKITDSP